MVPRIGGHAKRPHKKTRMGCTNCKRRRIKCDESKPSCRQCTQSLRTCEGYHPPKMWIFVPKRKATPDSLDIKNPSATGDIVKPADRRAFQFFVERTAPILSAYFGRSFWSVMLPQVSMFQPTVKHALIALSSLVEDVEYAGIDPSEDRLFHSSYSNAIKSLAHKEAAPSIQFFLMACLLFACADFMRAEPASGMQHIQGGLHMLDEWYESQYQFGGDGNPEDQIVLSLAPLFGPYLEKSQTYGVCSPLRCRNISLILSACELPYVPPQFFDIKEARHCLDGLSHYIVKIVESPANDSLSMALAPKIAAVLAEFKLSEVRIRLERSKQRLAVSRTLLQVHHQILTIMLRAWPECSTNGYRPFDDDFSFILGRYDQMLEFCNGQNIATAFASSENLKFHLGFIAPLFFTATQSTSIEVRRAAFSHLRRLRVFESNWNSCVAYRLAETLNEINDSRAQLQCCALPPSEQYPAHVHEVNKNSVETATLSYSCNRCRGDGATTILYPIDISGLQCARKAHWPLRRIMRISGYQGGVLSQPSTCTCDLRSKEQVSGPQVARMHDGHLLSRNLQTSAAMLSPPSTDISPLSCSISASNTAHT